jgi:two-component system, LytTR family, response regulator
MRVEGASIMHLRKAVADDAREDRERLADLLDTALELQGRLAALVGSLASERAPARRLAIRNNGSITFLRVDEIEWIDASGNYIRLNAGGESHLLRETMSGVEARLPPDRFVRIHRSAIVNLDALRELVPGPHGDSAVVLASGKRLPLSRGYRDRLEEALGVRL